MEQLALLEGSTLPFVLRIYCVACLAVHRFRLRRVVTTRVSALREKYNGGCKKKRKVRG